MSNRLTIKGQVTVPKEIREYLGLAGGCDCVEFSVAGDGTVILTKAEPKPRREMPAFGWEDVRTKRRFAAALRTTSSLYSLGTNGLPD